MELNRIEFEKNINKIKEKSGNHTEMISLYIPVDRSKNLVLSHLKHELSESQNIKDKNNRKNVLKNISMLVE